MNDTKEANHNCELMHLSLCWQCAFGVGVGSWVRETWVCNITLPDFEKQLTFQFQLSIL